MSSTCGKLSNFMVEDAMGASLGKRTKPQYESAANKFEIWVKKDSLGMKKGSEFLIYIMNT